MTLWQWDQFPQVTRIHQAHFCSRCHGSAQSVRLLLGAGVISSLSLSLFPKHLQPLLSRSYFLLWSSPLKRLAQFSPVSHSKIPKDWWRAIPVCLHHTFSPTLRCVLTVQWSPSPQKMLCSLYFILLRASACSLNALLLQICLLPWVFRTLLYLTPFPPL